MSDTNKSTTLNRRQLAGLAAGAAAFAASPALARQPHMINARAYTEAALTELRKANNNKGGYRKDAIEHLEYVLVLIDKGIEHAS